MGLFQRRQPGTGQQTSTQKVKWWWKNQGQQTSTQQQGQAAPPKLERDQGQGELNLVNYSPEELVQQVDAQLSRVQFGWTFNTKFMENFSEVWAVVGPIILLLGTIGEVFLVLWLRQKAQDILAGMSIVAVAAVLEGTFLAVSYKAATMRNRAEKRDGGPSELDRVKLKRQFRFWIALASGVCATQIIFIAAQTKSDGIGLYGVWIFAILRSVFTLTADGYTAFAHEEKPTDGDRAEEEREQRAKLAERFLAQKNREIDVLNEGILKLRETHTEAKIKEDKQDTRLKVERLQNKAQVTALTMQQEQATMFAQLGANMMRALFDPSMDEDSRQKLLSTMQGFMSAANALPESSRTLHVDSVREEDV